MDIFTIYITMFFIVFLVMPITYFFLRFLLWLILEYCGCSNNSNNSIRHRNNQRYQQQYFEQYHAHEGNIFTISDDVTGNNSTRRYTDFFYLEPSTEEAARIRTQLEKDDKDLPSYEEVMRISEMTANHMFVEPTAACGSTTTMATTDSILTVPPYSEIDPIITETTLPPSITIITPVHTSESTISVAVQSTSRTATAVVSNTIA